MFSSDAAEKHSALKGAEAADEPEEEQFLQEEEITPRSRLLQERLRRNMEVAYFYVHLRTVCAVVATQD